MKGINSARADRRRHGKVRRGGQRIDVESIEVSACRLVAEGYNAKNSCIQDAAGVGLEVCPENPSRGSAQALWSADVTGIEAKLLTTPPTFTHSDT